MKRLIHVYPYVFVDGTKVGGVSKIDYETKTVTCFDPEAYNSETKTFGKREVSGEISFFIEDAEKPSERYHFFDGTKIVVPTDSTRVEESVST